MDLKPVTKSYLRSGRIYRDPTGPNIMQLNAEGLTCAKRDVIVEIAKQHNTQSLTSYVKKRTQGPEDYIFYKDRQLQQ